LTESFQILLPSMYFTYYWPICVIHVHALIDNYIGKQEQMHSIITYNLQLKYSIPKCFDPLWAIFRKCTTIMCNTDFV